MARIELRQVTTAHKSGAPGASGLRSAGLLVAEGEWVALLGRAGGGTSRVLHLIAGLAQPSSGTILVGGTPVSGPRPDVGLTFRTDALLPWLSALDNVALAVAAARPGRPRAAHHARAACALARLGLGDAMAKRPGQLSAAQRRRVAIARALAIEPAVLLLDDPLGGLDAASKPALRDDLVRLLSAADGRLTTVLATPDVEDALIADRVVPLGGTAPTGVGAPISIALSRTRRLASLAHDDQGARARACLVAALTAA